MILRIPQRCFRQISFFLDKKSTLVSVPPPLPYRLSAPWYRTCPPLLTLHVLTLSPHKSAKPTFTTVLGRLVLLERSGINLRNSDRPPKYDSPFIGPYRVLKLTIGITASWNFRERFPPSILGSLAQNRFGTRSSRLFLFRVRYLVRKLWRSTGNTNLR